MWSKIVCLDDVLREAWWPARAFFYDLVREPILQGSGLHVPDWEERGLMGFRNSTFLNLVGAEEPGFSWQLRHHFVPPDAAEYLVRSIPPDSLVLSFEMPPWLSACLTAASIPFLEIRVSPLRFASDLYVAWRTNNPDIFDRSRPFIVSEDEILLEAGLVAASVRHLRAYKPNPRNLDSTLIYAGQTKEDASLVGSDGQMRRITDFADALRAESDGRTVLYKPHPSAGAFAVDEQRTLSEIIGLPVDMCYDDTYELLGLRHTHALVAISSGLMQEAPYFNRPARTLFRSVCPLGTDHTRFDSEFYRQVRFSDFVAPRFWHDILTPEAPLPRVERLPILQPNHLRGLHNTWWGYSTFLVHGRHFWREAFDRGGGWDLRNELLELQRAVTELHEAARRVQK